MIYVAAITPRGGHGEIDAGAVFELIDYLCSALKGHQAGIALFDAAGEYPALNTNDRARVLRLAVKRSRVPVIAGAGSATLEVSLELAREAHDAGVDAVLLPPPYFYPYRQEEVREFYLQFRAQSGGGEIYLENLPAFTTGIEMETAQELLSTGRFSGIADSTGEHRNAMAAADRLFVEARCTGRPAISAAACAAPELMRALDAAIGAGNEQEIARLSARLEELLDWADLFPPFTLVRVATGLRGIKTGPLAMPLPPEKQRKMEEFREWFASWK